jgi:PhnB protein
VIAAGRLQPSSKGRRLFFRDGKPAVTDGPFTESKELIAGFSILEVPSIDDAVPWATRFAKLLGDIEIEMRPLY